MGRMGPVLRPGVYSDSGVTARWTSWRLTSKASSVATSSLSATSLQILPGTCMADVDNNGAVNSLDLIDLLFALGTVCP